MNSSPSELHPFLRPQIRLSGVIDVVATLCLCATFAGWLGRWFWLFDLCDHFRLQLTVLSLVAVGWFWVFRRRWFAVFAVSVSMVNAVPILQTTWVEAPEGRPDPASAWSLSVCCFNVLASNSHKEEVISYLARPGARCDRLA